MEWTPEMKYNVDTEHALNKLNRMDKIVDLTKTINLLPLSKLKEIEKFINENK